MSARTPCEILSAAGARVLAPGELRDWPQAAERPVLVAFVAEWCEVSLTAAPAISGLVPSLDGRAELACVDVDRAAQDVERLGVRSVPALVLFARGREIARRVGLAGEAELARFVSNALADVPPAAGADPAPPPAVAGGMTGDPT